MSMKTTPILMQTHLVAATLRGEKTQTRRSQGLKCTDPAAMTLLRTGRGSSGRFGAWFQHNSIREEFFIACPWGGPGDLAWVRESWRIGAWDENEGALCIDYRDGPRKEWIYLPDGEEFEKYWMQCSDELEDAGAEPDAEGNYKWEPGHSPLRWRQSIHMRRWASRLTLLLKEVRVERVNEISNADARAEGIVQTWGDFMECPPKWALDSISEKYGAPGSHLYDNRQSRENFRLLYESINGPGSFDGRWNWVLVYEPIAENVDTVLARFDKKLAGNLLDDLQHLEWPISGKDLS